MIEIIELAVTAVCAGIYCGARLGMILWQLFGNGLWCIPHIFCVLLLAVSGFYFYKRGYFPKPAYYIGAWVVGIALSFTAAGLSGELKTGMGILSAVGAGFTNSAAVLALGVSVKECMKHIKKPDAAQIMFILAAALIFNILAAVYVGESSYIYSWDNATYWSLAQDIAAGKLSDGGFWGNVYKSVSELDYNYVGALIPALAVRIFGNSRIVYILTIINVYLMPCVWAVYSIGKKMTGHPRAACVTSVLLCPIMFYASVEGFVDIGGVFLCLLCFRIMLADRAHAWQGIIIGVLIAAAVIFRRWYAFFGVSFIAVMLAGSIGSMERFKRALAALVTSGFILGIYFGDFVVMKLMKNYSQLYASYKFDIHTDYKLLSRYFGIIPALVVLVIGILAAVKSRLWVIPFAVVQAAVCFVMFVNTQTHGQQHLLLYIPAMVVMICACISLIPPVSRTGYIAAGLAMVNVISVIIPRPQPDSVWQIDHYAPLPDFSVMPKKRTDILSILELKAYLDTLPRENGETVGILSNSFVLNESIVQLAEASVGINSDADNSYIIGMPSVDSRDTTYDALYNANYMVVAFPAQTHLPSGQQCVVEEAVRSFEQYADIATAYTEDEREFSISGIKVKVYVKNRPNTDEEIQEFEERLEKSIEENKSRKE